MKAIQTKTTTPAHNQQQGSQPFFKKAGVESLMPKSEPFFSPRVQTKLSIGQPNDKYEQEADSMADKVVQRLATPDISKKTEPIVQAKTISNFTPISTTHSQNVVQNKCAECEKEEKLQKKENTEAQPELQLKAIFESGADDESNSPSGVGGSVQRKCATCGHEEEKKVQKKEGEENFSSPSGVGGIESSLSASKGGGSPLPENTRNAMESSFGSDFSGVRIHTDSNAVQMSKDLNAQAFTHGNDIYFNSGKYDTGSKGGQHLLAHELTHTVQQGGGVRRQAMPEPTSEGILAISLTNRQLIDEISLISRWTQSHQDEDISASRTRLNHLLMERERRVTAGNRWLMDPNVTDSTVILYQILQSENLSTIINANTTLVSNSTGSFNLGGSIIITNSQLSRYDSLTGRILTGVGAASVSIHGVRATIIPPDMMTLYHGTSAGGADSIRASGVNPTHAEGHSQDFGSGFYTSEDPAVGEAYSSARGRTDGAVVEFSIPREQLGVVVDIRTTGKHFNEFQRFLELPYSEAMGNSSPIRMTVREFYRRYGIQDGVRGSIFERFLLRIGMQHADVVIGPLGNDIFTGITTGVESTQMSIRTPRAAGVLNQSLRGESFAARSESRMPTPTEGAVAGGVVGGVVAIVIQGGVILINSDEHPHWQRELTQAGVLGGGSGALGGAIDTAIASRVVASGGTVIMGRMMGGTVAGGVAAPIFEMGQMALSDRDYTGTDYAARGTRAAASGAISGAVSAGIVGAIWGSEVPILGNIVGFIIGFGVYMAADAMIGNTVEDTVRDVAR